MKVLCPKCAREIAPDDVNIGKDTGYCQYCKELFSLSELQRNAKTEVQHGEDLQLLQQEPPFGVRLMRNSRETIVLVRHSRLHLLFLVPFTAVWSGFSMFGLYGIQFFKHKFDLARSLAGLPFLIATIILLFCIIYPIFTWVMLKFNSNGITLRRFCFKAPELTDEFQVSSSSQEELTDKKGFHKWENLRNVRLQVHGRKRDLAAIGEDTLMIPPLPRKRQNYILALIREEARKHNVTINVQEELLAFRN